MPRLLELIDTSVVLELLQVPFESDRHEETVAALTEKADAGIRFQLPVASVIETGAHIGRVTNGHHRRECARRFGDMIDRTIGRTVPWSFTSLQWDETFLRELQTPSDARLGALSHYLETATLETGDLLIVAEFRRVRDNLDRRAVTVDVWTLDEALAATIALLR